MNSFKRSILGLFLSVLTAYSFAGIYGPVINTGGVASTGGTGTGKVVFNTSPTLITPVLGVASATSLTVTGNTTVGSANTTDYIIKPGGSANTGALVIQSGPGSATSGGAINLYSHTNATHPGDVVVGISSGSGGSFRVNSAGTDGGTDVLSVVGASGNTAVAGSFSAGTQYSVNGTMVSSATAPTISSGFGSSPSIDSNNGTATFRVNVGTGGTATNGVIGLPTAKAGWNCIVQELAPNAAALLSVTVVTTSSTTSVTVQNDLLSTGAATAWQASQVLILMCAAY